MLSIGVEPVKVMKMGGWKDLKTLQIYFRKAGIEIKGITDNLSIHNPRERKGEVLFLSKVVSRAIKNLGVKRAKIHAKFYEILNRFFANFKHIKLQDETRLNAASDDFSLAVDKYSKVQTEQSNKRYSRLDSVISRNFTASYMNNAKWVKLMKAASAFYSHIATVNYKLVNSDEIKTTFVEEYEEQVDDYFFVEPIFYKEIEWLEFRCEGSRQLAEFKAKLEQLAKFELVTIDGEMTPGSQVR